jgi:hypothetical protein
VKTRVCAGRIACIRSSRTIPSGEPKLADNASRGAKVSNPQRRISSAGASSKTRDVTVSDTAGSSATLMDAKRVS